MLNYFKHTPNEEVEDVPISLERALQELENLPIEQEIQDSFLGFTRKEKTIQFIRYEDDFYLIDIPLFKEGELIGSKQAELTLAKAKHIVTLFANDEEITDDILDPQYSYSSKGEGFEQLPREMRDSAIPSEYKNEIKCECGSTQFKAIREGVAIITPKCTDCSTSYSLEVNISDDEEGVNPVITFIKQD